MQLTTIQTISLYLQTVKNWCFQINLWKEMPRTFVETICNVCLIFSRPRRWPLGKQVKKLWNSLSLSLMIPLNQVWFNILMIVRTAQKLRGAVYRWRCRGRKLIICHWWRANSSLNTFAFTDGEKVLDDLTTKMYRDNLTHYPNLLKRKHKKDFFLISQWNRSRDKHATVESQNWDVTRRSPTLFFNRQIQNQAGVRYR